MFPPRAELGGGLQDNGPAYETAHQDEDGPGPRGRDAEACEDDDGSNDEIPLRRGLMEFATGTPQAAQVKLCSCQPYSFEEIRDRQARMVPCFVNVPLACCRREVEGEVRGCSWGPWWCCTTIGNFTVLLERRYRRPGVWRARTVEEKEERPARSWYDGVHGDGSSRVAGWGKGTPGVSHFYIKPPSPGLLGFLRA